MQIAKDSTISAFNEYITTLKKEKDKLQVSLTKFNSEKIDITFSNKEIKDVPALTKENYKPDHMTNLYDAIGKTINALNTKKQDKVLFVIITDGEENASKEFKKEAIQALIKEKEKNKWTFVYLGANQDAWLAASFIGIAQGNAKSFSTSNMKGTMQSLGKQTVSYSRAGGQSSSNFWRGTNGQK
jgi:transcriptional regulator of acetoin/glycerol metabolism